VTHLVNFAQGEMAMFSTYIAWSLINAGMGYWPAFLLTVLLAFVLGVVIERVVIRPVENAPVLAIVVIFIALLVILNSATGWIYTYTIKTFPSPFPKEPLFGNRYMSSHELGAIASPWWYWSSSMSSPLHAAGTRNARRGAEPGVEPAGGHSRGLDARPRWGLAAAVGAVAGMMIAPIVYLDPNMMGGILLYAFAAALLGGIGQPRRRGDRRLRGRCARERARRLRDRERPQALGGAGAHHRRAAGEALGTLRQGARDPRMTRRVYIGVAVLLAIACVLPFVVSNYRTFQLTLVLVYAIALLGLNILTGYNGQISLGHGAFYAIGAYSAPS